MEGDRPDRDDQPLRGQRFGGCARTGGGVAWAAFEGSFRYDELLSERVAHQVYGYCVSGAEPVVEWDIAVLRSDEWRLGIAEVRAALDDLLSDSA